MSSMVPGPEEGSGVSVAFRLAVLVGAPGPVSVSAIGAPDDDEQGEYHESGDGPSHDLPPPLFTTVRAQGGGVSGVKATDQSYMVFLRAWWAPDPVVNVDHAGGAACVGLRCRT